MTLNIMMTGIGNAHSQIWAVNMETKFGECEVCKKRIFFVPLSDRTRTLFGAVGFVISATKK